MECCLHRKPKILNVDLGIPTKNTGIWCWSHMVEYCLDRQSTFLMHCSEFPLNECSILMLVQEHYGSRNGKMKACLILYFFSVSSMIKTCLLFFCMWWKCQYFPKMYCLLFCCSWLQMQMILFNWDQY
jgi:hypothetical protein